MKNSIVLFVLVFCWITAANAQSLSIYQGVVDYEKQEYPCIEVRLSPEPKAVKKAWEDFLKKEYDVNLKGIGFLANRDVLQAEAVKFEELTEKKLDFYTEVVAEEGMTRMSVFASLGYDIHLAPSGEYASGFRTLENIVRQFLQDYLPEYHNDRIDTLTKEAEDLEKDIEKLDEEQKDNEKRIAELEKELEDLRKDNQSLSEEATEKRGRLQDTREQLRQQKEALQAVQLELGVN